MFYQYPYILMQNTNFNCLLINFNFHLRVLKILEKMLLIDLLEYTENE